METPFLTSMKDGRLQCQERSAYVAVCTLFERCLPRYQDVAKFKFTGVHARRSVFEFDRIRLDRMFSEMQSSKQVDSVFQSVAEYELGEKLTYSDLRYCLPCLRQGQHSVVFQHGLVRKCPLHSVDLRTGCPACGARLKTDIETIRVSPFSCYECGHALRVGFDIGVPPSPLPSAPFDALRLKYGAGTQPGFEWSRSLMRWHRSTPSSKRDPECSDFRRAATRHSDWTTPSDFGSISWKTRAYDLNTSGPIVDSFVVSRTVQDTLLRIRDAIAAEGIDIDTPSLRPWIYVQYSRLHFSLTVAAAALYRAANLYNILDVILNPSRQAEFLLDSFGPLPTEYEAAKVVVQHEVLGLFVRCLSEASRYNHMADINWLDGPLPENFCPAWLLERHGLERKLKIRALACHDRLPHLIRRLGARRVSRCLAHDEVARLEKCPPRSSRNKDRSQRARNYPDYSFLARTNQNRANL